MRIKLEMMRLFLNTPTLRSWESLSKRKPVKPQKKAKKKETTWRDISERPWELIKSMRSTPRISSKRWRVFHLSPESNIEKLLVWARANAPLPNMRLLNLKIFKLSTWINMTEMSSLVSSVFTTLFLSQLASSPSPSRINLQKLIESRLKLLMIRPLLVRILLLSIRFLSLEMDRKLRMLRLRSWMMMTGSLMKISLSNSLMLRLDYPWVAKIAELRSLSSMMISLGKLVSSKPREILRLCLPKNMLKLS